MGKTEFKELFDNYFDELRAYIYYRCGDVELAGDIAQESFMRVWENRENLNLDKIKGYLFTIAQNIYISNYRHERVKIKFQIEKGKIVNNDQQTPHDVMCYSELQTKLEKSLEQMPETARAAFLMSRLEGLAYKEIAERLNIGIKAVEKRISVALSFLKENLMYEKNA